MPRRHIRTTLITLSSDKLLQDRWQIIQHYFLQLRLNRLRFSYFIVTVVRMQIFFRQM